MTPRFDEDRAREALWEDGLDPDELPDNPIRRDEYLRKVGMDPDQFKPRNLREKKDPPSSSGGCFLTSACVQAKGLPDDCEELETLRRFRDTYMMATEEGQAEVEHYYMVAPAIVVAIDALPDAGGIWNKIYTLVILPAVELIRKNDLPAAYRLYKSCVLQLEAHFVPVSSPL